MQQHLRQSNITTALKIALLFVFVIGLYRSLQIVFHTFPAEADFSDTAMLWLGFKKYGWHFFPSWRYTTDNWLLSLVPIHFLLFSLFGAKPLVVLLTGWGIFILTLLMVACIASSLRAPKTAILLPFILLFANQYAHAFGFLTYSISHNITNLYGICCLFITIKWLQHRRAWLLVCLFFVAFIGGVSDPWMLGAYLYPIIMTSMLFSFIYRKHQESPSFWQLGAVLFLVVIGSKSRGFELLHFLPLYHHKIHALNSQNIFMVIQNLGRLFNILPLGHSTHLLLLSSLFSVLVFFYLLYKTTDVCYKKYNATHNVTLYFLTVTILISLFAIITAMIVTESVNEGSSRFMLNIFYLGPLLIAINAEKHWPELTRTFKKTLIIAVILYIISSIVSNLTIWQSMRFTVKKDDVLALVNVLEKNHLQHGYGPYWGANANAITWLSHGKIQFVPVIFSKKTGFIINGKRYQSSLLWKAPSAHENFFIFVKNDGEECANISLCKSGIIKQFGQPSDIIKYKDADIFIWKNRDHTA